MLTPIRFTFILLNVLEQKRVRSPGIVVDFDTAGKPVGIDIDHARKVLDLTTLEAESLPLKMKAA